MALQQTSEPRKSFVKKDGALVCGILVFYGICFMGLLGAVYWGVTRRYETSIAAATSRAQVAGTQQSQSLAIVIAAATQRVQGTATALAHATEMAGYEVVDPFDADLGRWITGTQSNESWAGSTSIEDGHYVWNVTGVMKPVGYWADFKEYKPSQDFDLYVDTKFLGNSFNKVCNGVSFRNSASGWDHGGYAFILCNNMSFRVDYHGQDGWEKISGTLHSRLIRNFDWNRMEVNARGDSFIFTINNVVVYEMTDDRQKEGGIALFIELFEGNPTKVAFDNFGYRSR